MRLALTMLATLDTTSLAAVKPPFFKLGVSQGTFSASYDEISDLTHGCIAANDAFLWGVDDGILTAVLAINKSTLAVSEWAVTGFNGVDVESLTSFAINGQGFIVIGDTGNNANSANSRGSGIDVRLARCKEPTITGSNGTISAPNVELIDCVFPAGNLPSHRDCECILSDPQGNIYFVTKRITPVKVYMLAYAASYSGIQTLTFLGDMTNDATFNTISTTPSGNNGYVVGGCMSTNGREIFLKSYRAIYRWARQSNQSIIQALQTAPSNVLTHEYVGGGLDTTIPNQEPQGEAMTLDRAGLHLFHAGELVAAAAIGNPPLFKMERLSVQPTVNTFQQGASGYSGCVDTFLDQATPTQDNSAAVSLVADFDYSAYPTVSRNRQTLVKFDVSSIPNTKTVVGAYLELYVNTEGLGAELFKMLVTWNALSNWNSLSSGVAIDNVDASSTPCGSYGDSAAATEMDNYVGFVRINLDPAVVQSWVTNSAANFGLLIQGHRQDTTGDGQQYDSSKSATQARKPKLTVLTV